jgi:LuxR family maltose regulon positive regulatory protein
MTTPLLTTKLYIPPPTSTLVPRTRLVKRLEAGTRRKLTLVSAPAGFGKTTLVSSWVAAMQAGGERRVAWLSLDAGDNDPARFIAYLVAAVRTIAPEVGGDVLALLQAAQQAAPQAILAALLNDFAVIPGDFVLVLDDLHIIDAQPVEDALAFLLDYLPPHMHLVITSREDPTLPLARLRARGDLTEIRATDLRFTDDEAAAFLNTAMGLALTAQDVAALDARTEGWIAGLQLAAISLQGHPDDAPAFIESFTGSHRFVMDYLVEEVLIQQPEAVQAFLLRTSVLDRLCGPLCDAVVGDAATPGQATLEALERANLFLVPLDNERRWYRYHHLFGDLLRQRLRVQAAASSGEASVAALHGRASEWYEVNGFALDAFQHATAANDIARADRLLAGKGMPLHFRGAVTPVLNWLASLPPAVLDVRPRLWVMYASALSMAGRLAEVEAKLQGAEAALRNQALDADGRNLVGHIAAIRGFLAATQHDAETIIAQSQIALEYLHPDNLPVRTATAWKLGIAYHLRGERSAAVTAYEEAISAAERSGNLIVNVSARAGLGQVQEANLDFQAAEATYRAILDRVGGAFQPAAGEAHLGLARIRYERNELTEARRHAKQSLRVAEMMQNADNPVACRIFLARLALAEGDADAAVALAAEADAEMRRHHVLHQARFVANVRVRALLAQGNVTAAAEAAAPHDLPLCVARVRLAQGDAAAALAILERAIAAAEARQWAEERLRGLALHAVALHAGGQGDAALDVLELALGLAAPVGCVRLFVDEGAPMAALLAAAERRGVLPAYTRALLDACAGEPGASMTAGQATATTSSLVDPLSERELEILALITQGLKNQEIADQLIISLNTVLYHTKNLYGKLGVNKRALAIARARELGLI